MAAFGSQCFQPLRAALMYAAIKDGSCRRGKGNAVLAVARDSAADVSFESKEANELCLTLEDNENKSRTASEMAYVLYHAMVLLALKDVKIEDALENRRKRFLKSGIEEK